MADFGDRIIVLIDMDCFFCQVEAKLKPEYKGKPMAVVQYNQWRSGGIIAVNYEARDFGVTRHMRGDDAKEKCPGIILAIVPSLRGKADTSRYRAAGRSVIDVLKTHCNKIERASVDEAYLDITQLVDARMSSIIMERKHFPEKLNNTYVIGYVEVGNNNDEERKKGIDEWLHNAFETNELQAQRLAVAGIIVEEIRADIYNKTEYRCSAGISYNKILAKLACGLHKQNRQTVLPFTAVSSLFSTLPVKKVRNLGGKFGDIVIESLNCNVMSDLLQYSLQHLQNRFDEKTGLWLYNIARGIDNEPVTTRLVSKSIGACKKFPGKQAITESGKVNKIYQLKHWLGELASEVCERLEQDNEENERRATLLTLSYQFIHNSSITSQSKSLSLNSYKQDLLQKKCFDIVSRIQNPIIFLGLSAGKFIQAKGSENFVNFFKCDKIDPTSKISSEDPKINDSADENIEKLNSAPESKQENIKCEILNESDNNINTPREKKVTSFFKYINKIETPKSNNANDNTKSVTDMNSGSSKMLFKIENNSSNADMEHLSEELSENKNIVVKLQDIFPNLDNIDTDVLSYLPMQLQQEAALLIKNKKIKKSLSSIGKLKNSKTKMTKRKKNEGKSINKFVLKTGNDSNNNFQQCERCGQMISKDKFNEHKDYHVAQNLHKIVNKAEERK